MQERIRHSKRGVQALWLVPVCLTQIQYWLKDESVAALAAWGSLITSQCLLPTPASPDNVFYQNCTGVNVVSASTSPIFKITSFTLESWPNFNIGCYGADAGWVASTVGDVGMMHAPFVATWLGSSQSFPLLPSAAGSSLRLLARSSLAALWFVSITSCCHWVSLVSPS